MVIRGSRRGTGGHMLKIKEVKVFDLEYQGKKFPVIEAVLHIDGDDVPSVENFAPEGLASLLLKDGEPVSREACAIDWDIYAYVPDDLHEKSDKEIINFIEKEID